jgi:hypothetical protein
LESDGWAVIDLEKNTLSIFRVEHFNLKIRDLKVKVKVKVKLSL